MKDTIVHEDRAKQRLLRLYTVECLTVGLLIRGWLC